ncbi:MAG: DUF1761 domain-containing protein [Saprospiraceae bacterium]|nr:DUF1761 domain-containing protein [Saprospiraceae bacterium]
MPTNFYMFFVAGLIPLIIGFLYYSPKLAGNAWMKSNNFTEESLKGGNMGLILGLSYICSVLIAFMMANFTIHQGGAFGMMYPEVMVSGSDTQKHFNELMQMYGENSRSFTHGLIHGIITTLFFVTPIIAINALFERRGWKYILIHTGYWLITLALVGGLICSTLEYAPLS